MSMPFNKLPEKVRQVILHGSGDTRFKINIEIQDFHTVQKKRLEGIMNVVQRRYMQTKSSHMKRYYESFMSANPCNVCQGYKV